MSFDRSERRRTPLGEAIAMRIRRSGPISVAEYMTHCLHNPEHGYYRSRAGVGRDFVTAPEISQMFGEVIGLWCAVVWQQMGRPNPIRLIELGPGRGTMMRDMLSAARRTPDFLRAVHVHLVETSTPLAAEQRARLGDAPVPVAWSDLPPEAATCASLVIANEFLDALPAHQYLRTDAGWVERAVCIDNGDRLQFCPGAPVEADVAAMLEQRFAGSRRSDIAEVAEYGVADWLGAHGERHPTAALFIDYGHMRPALGDTLQAVRRHRPEHPLGSPGEADLTMHVDFASLAAKLTVSPHLSCDGPVTQAEFLGGLGLVERASRLMAANPARALEIETAAQRLLAPGGMGGRFKVLGARSRQMPALPGLAPAALPSS